MKMQTIGIGRNRTTPVQIEQAIENFSINANQRGSANVFWQPNVGRLHFPGDSSQLARRNRTCATNTSPFVVGCEGVEQCDGNVASRIRYDITEPTLRAFA